jgi:hypothetical protein
MDMGLSSRMVAPAAEPQTPADATHAMSQIRMSMMFLLAPSIDRKSGYRKLEDRDTADR